MADGTGRIVDFSKPNQDPLPTKPIPVPEIRRVDMAKGVEVVDVRMHETLISEGDGKIRRKEKQPGEPEIRLRVADLKEWERVRRLEED